MRKLFLIAADISTVEGATIDEAGACNLRFPTFELAGYPISSHRVALLKADVVERSPTPTLTLAGMPASPHKIAVMTPPRKKAAMLVQPSVDARTITLGLASILLKGVSAARPATCVPG